jgi:endogenous inhibitor of DNA gyrase (YacG/DUF329 family)
VHGIPVKAQGGDDMTRKKCPHCGKEVNIIPFGSRYIAVCCNQIVYVGQEPPQYDEKETADKDAIKPL